MGITFFNTLTRTKEEFIPITPGKVRMYTCGPTVYDFAHIGNLRAYVFADVLRKTLEFNGLKVKTVMNVTDVGHLVSDADEGEDKMAVAAAREQKSPWEIAEFYTAKYFEDTARLNIARPTVVSRATDHIPEMIAMVEEIMDNGYGYETDDGIYFDISKFPEYGQLSGVNLEKQLAGARVEVKEDKRNAADFLLWRKAPKEHIMQWESPWGMGYPGWHIECSAMSRKYLGDQFDIHTGGIDHIPIHHENEIAQSMACTGQMPARFWMHSEFLQVDGGKMSKSLGNIYTLSDLMEKGLEPLAFRYFCLGAHYRTKLNFTWDAIAGAQNGLLSLRGQIRKAVAEKPQTGGTVSAEAGESAKSQKTALQYREEFLSAMNDDLNTPRALAVVWEASRAGLGPELRGLIGDFDRILGLDLLTGQVKDERIADEDLPVEVRRLLAERVTARANKDWARSDELREHLRQLGYAVKDTKGGYEVTKV
jgi:cysteinyl-tRNA synthetase